MLCGFCPEALTCKEKTVVSVLKYFLHDWAEGCGGSLGWRHYLLRGGGGDIAIRPAFRCDVISGRGPHDGTQWRMEGGGDSDSDGMADFLDLDSDNDGVTDAFEAAGDADADSVPDYLDVSASLDDGGTPTTT